MKEWLKKGDKMWWYFRLWEHIPAKKAASRRRKGVINVVFWEKTVFIIGFT